MTTDRHEALLEALRGMLAKHGDEVKPPRPEIEGANAECVCEACVAARAAIRKASGE